jgi:hypothetical protein
MGSCIDPPVYRAIVRFAYVFDLVSLGNYYSVSEEAWLCSVVGYDPFALDSD